MTYHNIFLRLLKALFFYIMFSGKFGEITENIMKFILPLLILTLFSGAVFSQAGKTSKPALKNKSESVKKSESANPSGKTGSQEKKISPFEKAAAGLKSDKPAERRIAIETLASLRDPAAITLIKPALKDMDYSVKIAAVDALGALRCYECEKDLSLTLAGEKNIQVRQACVISLSYLGKVSDPSALISASDIKEEKSLRISAIRTLGALRVQEAEKKFISYLEKEKDPDIKKALIDALGKMNSQKGLQEIRQYVSDPDYSIRQYAVRALGDSGSRDFSDLYKARLTDENPSVALEAAFSLAKISDASGLELAHKYLDNKDFSLQNLAMQISALVGDAKTKSLIDSKIKESKDENFKAMLEFTKQRIENRLKNSK